MHLTAHEQERLMIHVAADVARKRLERKPPLALNYAEVVALLSAYVLEGAREGKTVAHLMEHGKTELQDVEVMTGVSRMVDFVQVEATFPDGTKLVTIRNPIFKEEKITVQPVIPGEVDYATQGSDGKVHHNEHLKHDVIELTVTNDDRNNRPIQVGSHYHFYEANPALTFRDADNRVKFPDRKPALGMRLNVPAGGAVRFEPGMPVKVQLVPLEGKRQVHGLRQETDGRPIPPASSGTGGRRSGCLIPKSSKR
ncbi:urease subunit gamma [Streptomyces sp. NPDC026206]|uniref:urease subunit gamma n=1 Tax=Streptomyces sp. NPDC026206 TaxID=3157089 RepID=UPI0033DC65B1